MRRLIRVTRASPIAYALMVGCALASGCGGDQSTGPTGSGLVVAELTGGTQVPESVRSINVYVVRIDIRTAIADSATAATGAGDDSDSVGGWTTIAAPNIVVNLAALLNGQMTMLGQGVVAAGPYFGLRVVIDPSRSSVLLTSGVTLTPQTSPTVSLPNVDRYGLPVQLLQPVVMTASGQVTVAVDFDAIESFVARGTSVSLAGMNFTPVLRATVN